MIYHVYLDWTEEPVPRVFYVGKGTAKRVKNVINRSQLWKSCAAKYGWKLNFRQVILSTKEEEFAYEEEIRLIAEYGTYRNVTGWGANRTRGGEGGVSGPTHYMKNPENVELLRSKLIGRKDSEETRNKKRAYQLSLGENHPMKRPDVRAKFVGEANPAKRPEVRAILSKNCPFKREDVKVLLRGERNANAKLTWELVKEIRRKYADGGTTHNRLAFDYGVTKRTITCVLNNLTWKPEHNE